MSDDKKPPRRMQGHGAPQGEAACDHCYDHDERQSCDGYRGIIQGQCPPCQPVPESPEPTPEWRQNPANAAVESMIASGALVYESPTPQEPLNCSITPGCVDGYDHYGECRVAPSKLSKEPPVTQDDESLLSLSRVPGNTDAAPGDGKVGAAPTCRYCGHTPPRCCLGAALHFGPVTHGEAEALAADARWVRESRLRDEHAADVFVGDRR